MFVIITENEQELLELLKTKNVKVLDLKYSNMDFLSKESTGNLLYSNISEFLLALGIRPQIKGFKYLEYLLSNDIDYSAGITRELYPNIAEYFNTTTSSVERTIRHAIQIALPSNEHNQIYTKVFGKFSKAPTNHQFIEGCKLYLKNNPIY